MSQSTDRLTVTMFLAGLFHLIVILGVSFGTTGRHSSVRADEEVLLDETRSRFGQERARELSVGAHPAGSGNSADGRTRRPGRGARQKGRLAKPMPPPIG